MKTSRRDFDLIKIPEELRVYASPWLQPILNRVILLPLAPQRFRALSTKLMTELRERAADHDATPEYELCLCARKALKLTIEGLAVPKSSFDLHDPESPRAQAYILKQIQKRINRIVTEDLLGPGWWRTDKEEAIRADHSVDIPFLFADDRTPILVAFLNDPRLSKRERELLEAIAAPENSTIEEAARAIGIRSSTARAMLVRIREKLTV